MDYGHTLAFGSFLTSLYQHPRDAVALAGTAR